MTGQVYTDKEILGDALTAEKTATNNYNTFANECVHENVRHAILHCLKQEHDIQQDEIIGCAFQILHGRLPIKCTVAGITHVAQADLNKTGDSLFVFNNENSYHDRTFYDCSVILL